MATTDSADSTDRKMAEKHTIWVLLIFQRKISRLVFSSSGQRLCSACCTRNTSRSAGTPLRRITTCWSTTNHGGGVPWITRASRPRGGLSTRSSTLGRALNSSRKSNSLVDLSDETYTSGNKFIFHNWKKKKTYLFLTNRMQHMSFDAERV